MIPLKFTVDDAQRAYDEWGANCGPGAVAAILGKSLDEVRPHLGDFEMKGHTTPRLMWQILANLGVYWTTLFDGAGTRGIAWPSRGLARIQFDGPWTAQGVPIQARYKHTHWVASLISDKHYIFDINSTSAGWLPAQEWMDEVVPWLLKECEPKANGRWWITHSVEIEDTHV